MFLLMKFYETLMKVIEFHNISINCSLCFIKKHKISYLFFLSFHLKSPCMKVSKASYHICFIKTRYNFQKRVIKNTRFSLEIQNYFAKKFMNVS